MLPDDLNGHCATCTYWEGDRDEAAQAFKDNPVTMDPYNGWAQSGGCGTDYNFMSMDVFGDAIATVEFGANFGCIYWKKAEEQTT